MSYSTSLPDLREASLDAIKALIVASLTDLNTVLSQGGLTPGLTFTDDMVRLGDPLILPKTRISIVGGGENDATDMEIDFFCAPVNETQGFQETLYTNIYLYLHPDQFPETDMLKQAEQLERARARIVGHLRKRVFNTPTGVTITLGSREHCTSPNYDTLIECKIQKISMAYTPKQMGNSTECVSAHLLHVGKIA